MNRICFALVSPLARCVLLAVLALPASANGQRLSPSRVGAGIPAIVALPAGTLAPLPRFAPPAGEEKDPARAGLLSAWLPGLGSFYAGNNTHGWVHMAVTVGAVGLALSGGGGCRSEGATCTSSTVGTVSAGLGLLVINDIWSIFTAVSDAKATRTTTPAASAKP